MDELDDNQQRRGVTLFRMTDAPALEATDFMTISPDSSPVPPEVLDSWGAGASEGAQLKVLVRDASGFSLVHVWFKPNYALPRHSHSSDCMYYVISGSAIMGNQTLRAGDAFFVPERAPYQYSAGPDGVEVLEVRYGTSQFDIKLSRQTPAGWSALAAATEQNRPKWADVRTSPTFAANTSSDGGG